MQSIIVMLGSVSLELQLILRYFLMCPQRKKAVLLLSSMHHNGEVNLVSGKPEIIEFYNPTKGGVNFNRYR
jgi:hypothetical protein